MTLITILICMTIILTTCMKYAYEYFFKIDSDMDSTAWKQLDRLIELESLYEVNAKAGSEYAFKGKIKLTLPVSDIEELSKSVAMKIYSNFGNKLKSYMISTYGMAYIMDYIKITSYYIVLSKVAEIEQDDDNI